MNRIDILFLVRSLQNGGSERQLVELAKGLQQRGHLLRVTTFYPLGALEGELLAANVPLTTVSKKGTWDVVGFATRLITLIRKERPAILHAYLPISNLLAAIIKPLFPRMAIVWGIRASQVDFRHYGWVHRLVFRLECCLSRFADLIIVNSSAGKEYYGKHGVPLHKMIVIPNGIDTDKFKPDDVAREKVRAKWGVKNNEVLIGLVGRLDPMKDHPTFLRAASLLAAERDAVRFVCVGGGAEEYRSHVKDLARTLGLDRSLIWAGNRSDMNAVYNALDIATSTSLGEGFSNIIGESMACGVPCVVTDVGDSAAVVGDTGKVIPPGEPALLFEAWKDLIDGPQKARIEQGRAARRRIVEQFGVSVLVERTEKALMGLSQR